MFFVYQLLNCGDQQLIEAGSESEAFQIAVEISDGVGELLWQGDCRPELPIDFIHSRGDGARLQRRLFHRAGVASGDLDLATAPTELLRYPSNCPWSALHGGWAPNIQLESAAQAISAALPRSTPWHKPTPQAGA